MPPAGTYSTAAHHRGPFAVPTRRSVRRTFNRSLMRKSKPARHAPDRSLHRNGSTGLERDFGSGVSWISSSIPNRWPGGRDSKPCDDTANAAPTTPGHDRRALAGPVAKPRHTGLIPRSRGAVDVASGSAMNDEATDRADGHRSEKHRSLSHPSQLERRNRSCGKTTHLCRSVRSTRDAFARGE